MNEVGGFKINRLTPEYLARRDGEEQALFPGSLYANRRSLHRGLNEEFETALHAKSEEAIQRVLTANPYLLQYAIHQSGHHGIWVFPKRMIRMQKVDGTPGLIPDYLVVACNSLGYSWHIIELKRYERQFANAKGNSLSTDGARAVVQCATYHAHFNQYIETVRNNIGVDKVIPPKDVIILIGDALTETPEQKTRRDEFCQLAQKVVIASYDRIRRSLANDLRPEKR